MNGTLTKISSTHQNLRTPSVVGEFDSLPAAGDVFTMTAPPLVEGAFRYIETSLIEQTWSSVLGGKTIVCFKTENSVYGLVVDDNAISNPA